jgi:hypothetical protein
MAFYLVLWYVIGMHLSDYANLVGVTSTTAWQW